MEKETILQSILPTLLEEFSALVQRSKNMVRRNLAFPEAKGAAKVAIGMRRAGKTYFLLQNIHALLQSGVELSQILYINFEDERLLPLSNKEMGELIDAFYTLYPENHQRQTYLFLDEVQNIENWSLVVRRLLDTKNAELYLTGSSAKLLSKEIATSLRGRSLSVEVWPYSFAEYLTAHHITPPEPPFGKAAYDTLRKHFIDYMNHGGFPATQFLPENAQLETLQNYVETVILRDIVERHHISNTTLLRYLIKSLLKNYAAPFSIHKFYRDLKSQGYKISKDTVYQYIDYIEDAYLAFHVPFYTESFRQQQTSPKKVYAIDTGLIKANSLSLSDNFGPLFENLVYLELRRQNKKIYFYRTEDEYEIDFITQDIHGQLELIQVVWDKSDTHTYEREMRALKAAEQALGIPGKLIDLEAFLRDHSRHE